MQTRYAGIDCEHIITVALFTGLRISEILGLTWDNIDVEAGTITVNKQLARSEFRTKSIFISPKNGKSRTIMAALSVMFALKEQRIRQAKMRLKAGEIWGNQNNLVFTMEDGKPLEQRKVADDFKSSLCDAGLDRNNVRFHDLRHTYAVNSIRAGDDIKSVQCNLGHASAAFTLDRYGHFTEQMKRDSAIKMQSFIKDVLNL